MTDYTREVDKLKRKAREAYLTYLDFTDSRSCGHALSQYMSPAASTAAREYDEAMHALRLLDPRCPPFTPLSASP